mgnify:CR=1 FL=1
MQTSSSSLVLRGISSMATKALLADLTQAYQAQTGVSVHIESVGGVDAAKRVAAGEAFDVVVLASDAIAKLTASGHIAAGSQVDLVHSGVSVAVRAGFDYAEAVCQGSRLKVATKYVNCAREHFANKGVHIDTIQLYGSMELAPLVGLADAIVDLVSTGNTLKANGLVEVEAIADISARLVVNQASYKRKRAQLQPFFDQLK